MWSYYGAKTTLVKLYPPPKYGKIIEPFAGTARYSLLYWDREIVLIDKYPVIVNIWKWLQQCSPKDVLGLPRMVSMEQSLDDFTFDCIEAKQLMGFLVAKTNAIPKIKPTARQAVARPNFINYSLQRIAKNLFKIKGWTIKEADYLDIPNEEVTWFIDPPYQYGGHVYKMSNRKIDFSQLGNWCKNRGGQIIVCENNKADWMDFKPLATRRGSNATTTEVIHTNLNSSYNVNQLKLL